MSDTPKRIHLLGSGRHEEAYAAAIIKPGMLVALNAASKLVPNPDVGGACEKAFALEDALQGRTIATDYAANELVSFVLAQPGDVVYAWAASGANLIVGDKVMGDGGGRLLESTGPEETLGIALDAVDLSDTGADPARCRVRIL